MLPKGDALNPLLTRLPQGPADHPNRTTRGVEYDHSAAAAEVAAGIDFFPGAGGGRLVPAPGRPIFAATTERVVSDPASGLAIGGFDSVAYFTDAAPRLGNSDFELSFAGVVWRFRNEGNRAAFIANPDVYMPRFGGYDPVAVARGASAPGHAELWAIAGERLYLFYSAAARDAFAGDPGSAIGAAERVWPAVLRKLPP